VINRTHDFGRKHRTAILGRKQSGGVGKEFFSSRSLKIHQLSESRIRQVAAQILFVVMKSRQILCRQINAIGFQIRRHIANDVGELESEAEFFGEIESARSKRAMRIPKMACLRSFS